MKGHWRMFASILLVILGVELVVMMVLSALPPMRPLVVGFVDALSLAILSAPLLWLIVAKPLALAAETEKLRLEARVASILQTSVDGILTTDVRGIIWQFNAGAEKIFGYAAREALGQHVNLLFPERALEAHGEHGERVAQLQGRRENGEIFPTEVTISKLGDGHDLMVTVVVRDITERRLAERAMQETESQLRAVLDNTPITIYATDSRGIFTLSEGKGLERVGLKPGENVGTSAFDLYGSFPFVEHSGKVVAGREVIRRVLAGESVNAQTELSGIHFDNHIRPLMDTDGKVHGIVGVAIDTTERRRAETELRLQSAALNAAANAIVITDRNGTIVWINQAFSTLTGYSAKEAIGENPRKLLKSGVQDQAFYKNLWDTILAGNVWRSEITNRRKDGSLYPEDQTITPVRDDGGEITHFIAIRRDLTEEKGLEAQFLRAQRMELVGRLASGIAHDFNNLLTVINGTADLALTDLKEGDPLRTDLQQIKQAGAGAASLTRQLLAFSSKQIFKFEVLNLSTLVTDLQGMLQSLIGEGIDLVVMPAKEVGSVTADPGQIEQVVMNLSVNARDAMPNGGTLTIEIRDVVLDEAFAAEHLSVQPGPHVMLAISDTGAGMDEATRTRIFEPFFTTKGPGKGTGLGLSTVYGIVRQSGGSIWVYSELGKGTTFEIYLPRVEAVAHKVQPAPTVTSVRGSETVLIVEDEDGVRHLAKRVLQLAGYTVLTASNGGEALLLLERHEGGPVHLIFTDMVMPGMTGRELATELKDIYPRTKVLFTSGYTDDAIAHNGLLDKATHFIGKPYGVAQLTRKVREVLDS